MDVAVAGATGFVGKNLVEDLNEDHRTISIDLSESELADESVVADVSNRKEYEEALSDVDVAFYLVHSMSQGKDFSKLEKECAEAFQEACENQGVGRIIYLTGMVPDEIRSEHMRSRTKTGEILGSGEPDLTEVGSAIIMGWESSSFKMIYQLSKRLPLMITPKWLKNKVQPIYIDDVIFYLREVMKREELRSEYVEIGGPEVYTYRELLEIMGEEVSFKPLIFTVPVLTPELSSYWMKFVTDVDYSLARALVDSIKSDMIVFDDGIDEYIEHECLGYRESIRKIMEEQGK